MRNFERQTLPRARSLRKSMTDAETILWSRIRRGALNGLRFRRQYPVGPYIVDFACLSAKLAVEIDGATHTSDDQIEHDEKRSAFLAACGWKVSRFTNTDVYRNLNGVLDHIFGLAHERSAKVE